LADKRELKKKKKTRKEKKDVWVILKVETVIVDEYC
jgi:hypothetical protein